MFLQFINKLSKAGSASGLRSNYQALCPELQALAKDPFEKSVFEYFDFITRVESKYMGVSFRELVKRKHDQDNPEAIEH